MRLSRDWQLAREDHRPARREDYLCAWCGDGFYQDDAEYYQITPPPKGSYEVLHHPLYGIRKDKRHEGPALIHIDCYRTYVRGGDAGGPRPFDK